MKTQKRYQEEGQRLIYLIGIGMGGEDQLTGQAIDCLEEAQVVLGANRMLDSVSPYLEGKEVLAAYKPSEMTQWLSSFSWDTAALVLSGDTGFYSGAEAAARAFEMEGWETRYVPGISSLSYFCSRLGRSWQGVKAVSNHGRECDVVSAVRQYDTCFVLLGGQGSVPELCRQLVSSGLGDVLVWAGENFSYENERIAWEMTPAELIMEDEQNPFGSLACVLVENPHARENEIFPQRRLKDSDFIRGKVPMTKETVRHFCLEKLCIGADAVCYDIGSGTGSVAAEMAMEIRERGINGAVYAIEKDREALELTETNYRKIHGNWPGFHIIAGEAPEALEGLESPTHAFIGGSSGHMREIIEVLLQANRDVRIVATAISLETVGELLSCMKEFAFEEGEITQLMAAPVEQMGSYHMPKAQNPVYVAVMQYPAEDVEEIEWQDL